MRRKIVHRCHDAVRHSVYGDPTYPRDRAWMSFNTNGMSQDQRMEWLRVHWPEEHAARLDPACRSIRQSRSIRKWCCEHHEEITEKNRRIAKYPSVIEAKRRSMKRLASEPWFKDKMHKLRHGDGVDMKLRARISKSNRKPDIVLARTASIRETRGERAVSGLLMDIRSFDIPE